MVTPDGDPRNGTARLHDLCQRLFTGRRLILASNRGPVEYVQNDGGEMQSRRGSGAVVTALGSLTQYPQMSWIASAMTDGDRRAAEQAAGQSIRSPLPGHGLSLRYIVTPRSTYHKYYNIFCNPLLWFLQHYMWNAPRTPNIDSTVYDAWENGYVSVNRAFAEAVLEEALSDETPPYIMLHDYHLYLVAGFIRARLPGAVIQHFCHIPWPAATMWQLLPNVIRTRIFEGLLANDIVGFQTVRDVRNFLNTCETYLEDAEVDHRAQVVWRGGRQTQVRAYPISIDTAELQRLARSPRVRDYEERLRSQQAQHTIIRVDRMEPSKNILRGFKAYEMMLRRHPELVGHTRFLAFLVPSRTNIRQYQSYADEALQLIDQINQRFGRDGWRPIELFYENNYPQAIAGMKVYDVLMVNAVVDGMNLVSKEGPTVNTRDGVLVLSEAVGAWEQLHSSALTVSPSDVEGTARVLHEAVCMSTEERHRRAEGMRRSVAGQDINHWLSRQFEDMIGVGVP